MEQGIVINDIADAAKEQNVLNGVKQVALSGSSLSFLPSLYPKVFWMLIRNF